jgi:hypothetical protein
MDVLRFILIGENDDVERIADELGLMRARSMAVDDETFPLFGTIVAGRSFRKRIRESIGLIEGVTLRAPEDILILVLGPDDSVFQVWRFDGPEMKMGTLPGATKHIGREGDPYLVTD